MSEQPLPSAPPPIQFDRAEYAEATGACPICKQPFSGTYFQVNEAAVCPRCADKLRKEWSSGSRIGRALRAFIFGVLACVVGAAIYFGIVAISGYELALVAIVLGLGVGIAVRIGSRGRGGWFYQLMAIILTYVSIGSAYSTLLIREIAKDPDAFFEKSAQQTQNATAGKSSVASESADSQPVATNEPASNADGPSTNAATANDDSAPDQNWDDLPSGEKAMAIFFLVIFVVASIFALPILHCYESPITIIILGVALYEAWKINKGRSLVVTGPFALGTTTPPITPSPIPDGRANG